MLQELIATEESGSEFGYAYRVFDNEDILFELDGNNNIVARYTHGPGIDEPLVMEKAGQSFFYHADGLGSITDITDSVGVVKQRYTYSSFGKIESQLDPNFVQPYTFTSREFDSETGLYFYRARYYDSSTGRFISVDPILSPFFRGLFGSVRRPGQLVWPLPTLLNDPAKLHPFSYVQNNPVKSIDPLGLQANPCAPPCDPNAFTQCYNECVNLFAPRALQYTCGVYLGLCLLVRCAPCCEVVTVCGAYVLGVRLGCELACRDAC